MPREGFPPQAVVDPEAAVNNLVHAAAGLELLNKIDGIDYVGLASIRLNAGGQCVGNLAEYIGVPEHEHVAQRVVETVQEAIKSGRDPEKALAEKLSFFVACDEEGKLLRSGKEELTAIQETFTSKPVLSVLPKKK